MWLSLTFISMSSFFTTWTVPWQPCWFHRIIVKSKKANSRWQIFEVYYDVIMSTSPYKFYYHSYTIHLQKTIGGTFPPPPPPPPAQPFKCLIYLTATPLMKVIKNVVTKTNNIVSCLCNCLTLISFKKTNKIQKKNYLRNLYAIRSSPYQVPPIQHGTA